jgi:hypothetical protein
MADIVSTIRAAAAVLLECPEHVQIEVKNVLVNLHKRADEMNAAADEIERLRITDEEQAALVSAIGYHVFDGQRETLERMLDRICPDDGGGD